MPSTSKSARIRPRLHNIAIRRAYKVSITPRVSAFSAVMVGTAGWVLYGSPTVFSVALAGVLFAGGALVAALTKWNFFSKGTTIHPGEEVHVLVTDGLMEYSRNPMYVGTMGMVLSPAVLGRTWWLFAPVLLHWGYLQFVIIPEEENLLRELYGPNYDDLCRRTGRWVWFL